MSSGIGTGILTSWNPTYFAMIVTFFMLKTTINVNSSVLVQL